MIFSVSDARCGAACQHFVALVRCSLVAADLPAARVFTFVRCLRASSCHFVVGFRVDFSLLRMEIRVSFYVRRRADFSLTPVAL